MGHLSGQDTFVSLKLILQQTSFKYASNTRPKCNLSYKRKRRQSKDRILCFSDCLLIIGCPGYPVIWCLPTWVNCLTEWVLVISHMAHCTARLAALDLRRNMLNSKVTCGSHYQGILHPIDVLPTIRRLLRA